MQHQIQRRWTRWRADAQHRRLLRQQVWQQRRARLRWTVRRRITGPTARRTRWAMVAVSVLLLGGVGVYATTQASGDGRPGSPSADGTARPTGNEPASPKAVRGAGSRGPGISRPGIFLSVAVNEFGEQEVTERLVAGEPLEELSLGPPPPLEGGAARPRLDDVQLSADGEPVTVPATIQEDTVITLTRPATSIELRYRVLDAVLRSEPSTPGRATVSLRPAAAASLADVPAVVDLRGTVHNLLCVDLPRADQLCGNDEGDGWRTRRLTSAASRVVALMDLPDPAA